MTVDERLAAIREAGIWDKIPPSPFLTGAKPLYDFQTVGVAHLLVRKRFILGDRVGFGKTVQLLHAFARLHVIQPQLTLVVVVKKTAVLQWVSECRDILKDIPIYFVTSQVPPAYRHLFTRPKDYRHAVYREVLAHPGSVLIVGHGALYTDCELQASGSVVGPFAEVCKGSWFVFDEIAKVRGSKSHIHALMQHMQTSVERLHGLTATILCNSAHEVQYLFEVVYPGLVPRIEFEQLYCEYPEDYATMSLRMRKHVRPQYKSLDHFQSRIAPWYLARTKANLPPIVHSEVRLEMDPAQQALYDEVNTRFQSGRDLVSNFQYLQQAVDCPQDLATRLGMPTPPSAKAEFFADLLDEELHGIPFIVFVKYHAALASVSAQLREHGYRAVAIHGKMNEFDRSAAQEAFQSGHADAVVITMAGGESINLQRAQHLVMWGLPLSSGDYVQLVGRLRRFGTIAEYITVHHVMVAHSVDTRVFHLLNVKFNLMDFFIPTKHEFFKADFTPITPEEVLTDGDA